MKKFMLCFAIMFGSAVPAFADAPACTQVVGNYEGKLQVVVPGLGTENLPIRLTFHSDGTFEETQPLYQSPNPFGTPNTSAFGTPGMGSWKVVGKCKDDTGVSLFSLYLIQVGPTLGNPSTGDGAVLAQETITWNWTLNEVTGEVVGGFVANLYSTPGDPNTYFFSTSGTVDVFPANRP